MLTCIALLTVGLAGCLDSDSPTAEGQTDLGTGLGVASPVTEYHNGTVHAGILIPNVADESGPESTHAMNTTDGNATAWVIALEWEAQGEATQNLTLLVREVAHDDDADGEGADEDPEGNATEANETEMEDDGIVNMTTGASALRLVIDRDDLDEDTTYEIVILTEEQTALPYEQPYVLGVSTFKNEEVDEEHHPFADDDDEAATEDDDSDDRETA